MVAVSNTIVALMGTWHSLKDGKTLRSDVSELFI